MVTGYPGTGKTALIQGLKQAVAEDICFFIEGKFDQYARSTPYPAISQAFEGILSFILVESDDQFHRWKDTIVSALDDLGSAILEILPRLALIIGPQPDIPPLKGQDAQRRFHYVFLRFIRAITKVGRPLVVFLDDLQWIDAASLTLLRAFAMDAHTESLLIIGAYRDSEVDTTHPLMLMLDGSDFHYR